MTPDRESRVERICQAALERDGSARAAFLAEACAGDASLRRDVESLLVQESAAAGFMSTPAAAFASGTVGDGTSFIGRRLGPYLIHARLGAGGMGEVYRAHDTKLGRDVAIKILPGIFTSDPDRLARFDREARLLASLNHPNIGAIYGLEDVDGVPSLVLELVEGETLQERLEAGDWGLGKLRPRGLSPQTHRALPVDEALSIARQIADALEVAHEKGIVHRDLKPANVKITPEGAVKVLDFGLAKAMVGDASGPDLSKSPTITGGDSKEGVILGTAAYMSPGQARGRPVDKRADVWAFGCVLYEMLTGRLAFPGDTLSDTIVNVLQGEPDWRALPETTPAGIRRLLRRCLEKDPTRRLRDIGDARLDIAEALTAPEQSQTVELPSPVRRWSTRAAWALAAASTAAAIGMAVVNLRGTRAAYPNAVRFTVAAPLNADIGPGIPAVSPDGRRFAFVAQIGDTRQLWVHSLDTREAQPLRGTEGADSPFWSPDSQTLAFRAEGKLKATDADGGSVHILADVPDLAGSSWGPHGDAIVFATLTRGLFSVPASGGSPTPLPDPDPASAEARLFPTILPDGRHFVYLSSPSNVAWVGSLDGKERPERLMNAESQVQYVAPGFLVFVRRGTLMAQRFDAQRRTLTGDVLQIAEGVLTTQTYDKAFGTSSSGILVYHTDRLNVVTQLTWADRAGRRLGVVGNPGRYRNPELSPDGSYVALEVFTPQSGSPDIWRMELERGAMTRVTRDPGAEIFPVWSPDGAWIVFGSNREGSVFGLYRARADETGGEERLFRSPTTMLPQAWAPDSKLLLYQGRPAFKLGVLPISTDAAPQLFDDSESTFEGFGQVSPNGLWRTYASRERDGLDGLAWDVYVQRFPTPGLDKWRVTTNWGASPRWSRDGREILYYARDGRLMTVAVTSTGPALKFGSPVPLFEASLLGGPVPVLPLKQQYDVAKDGRFLLNVPVEAVSEQAWTVVVNWTAALKR